jgi:hypothetical protein
MSVTACILIVLGATTLALVISLLIPVPDPDEHPFETDPEELAEERVGSHRAPEDEGPTRRLVDGPLRYPLG